MQIGQFFLRHACLGMMSKLRPSDSSDTFLTKIAVQTATIGPDHPHPCHSIPRNPF
uniref:Uncharacterized protein n=1 Tax=Ralstonia solanacearum TaxID=305 RepID=A0A0S4WLT8_RALSL|nr:protein of unknown function [Ralstonia solanacearum]